MEIIGTLGPEGTFSDIATKKYIAESDNDYSITYFSSIRTTLQAIGRECDYGILPIENYSEGFVSLVLDTIADSELFITGEIILPIQFSFVTNTSNPLDIERLFVQFVARNQCTEFIDSLENVEIIITESNITSLEKAHESKGTVGAIVPVSSYREDEFQHSRRNVNDFCNNQTRFLMFSETALNIRKKEDIRYKTSIIVYNDDDRPGLLESILAPFSKREINLTSITSRPTKKKFGRYNFFIGFEGHLEDEHVNDALLEIARDNRLNIFGSYPMAAQPTFMTEDN